MSSMRWLLFGMVRRTYLVNQVSSKIHHPFLYFHTSKCFFSDQPIEIKMPSLSPTMTEGTIVKWLKKEGDTVSPGDVLCEIETDKAVVGLEVEEEGTLSKILVPEDTKNIKLGEVIAIMVEEGVDISQVKYVPKPAEKPAVNEEVKSPAPAVHKKSDSCRLGPAVKKLLQEYGVDNSSVRISGPHDTLLKGDVLHYIKEKNLKPVQITSKKPSLPSPPVLEATPRKKASHIDVPVTELNRSFAQQLVASKNNIPHVYMNVDCMINKLFEFKKNMNMKGIEISLHDFIVKSAATALRNVPKINAINQNGLIQCLESIDIAISFSSNNNKVMPLVRNADKMTMEDISKILNSSVEDAAKSKLNPDNISVHSFRIHALDVSEFSAVILPPQVATLAVGSVHFSFEGQTLCQRLKATLSFDNTLIDEAEALSFLNYFKQCLENPLNISCLT